MAAHKRMIENVCKSQPAPVFPAGPCQVCRRQTLCQRLVYSTQASTSELEETVFKKYCCFFFPEHHLDKLHCSNPAGTTIKLLAG